MKVSLTNKISGVANIRIEYRWSNGILTFNCMGVHYGIEFLYRNETDECTEVVLSYKHTISGYSVYNLCMSRNGVLMCLCEFCSIDVEIPKKFRLKLCFDGADCEQECNIKLTSEESVGERYCYVSDTITFVDSKIKKKVLQCFDFKKVDCAIKEYGMVVYGEDNYTNIAGTATWGDYCGYEISPKCYFSLKDGYSYYVLIRGNKVIYRLVTRDNKVIYPYDSSVKIISKRLM